MAVLYSPREIILETFQAIHNDTRSSDPMAIREHSGFTVLKEFYGSGEPGHERAITVLLEELDHYPQIACPLLAELLHPPIIPESQMSIQYCTTEYWLVWAENSGYSTERTHLLLALVRMYQRVADKFERLLAVWQHDKSRARREKSWETLVGIGRRYPSVVYPIVITKWALPRLTLDEGHALMAAISGIDDPVESLRHAPAGVEPNDFDPDSRFSSWYEWFRRWGPTVMPYRLWS